MSNLEKKRLRGDLMALFQYLKGCYSVVGKNFLCVDSEGRSRISGLKLQGSRLRLDIKNFLTIRAVWHWKILPCAVVSSPSLEVFQAEAG